MHEEAWQKMNDRMWKIYTLSDPLTHQVRYVGRTFRGHQRLNEHMSRAIGGGKTQRDCWIRSLASQGLRPIYQVRQEGQGPGWKEAELSWIAFYRDSDLVNHAD